MVIYKIVNKINNKVYVGQTRSKPTRRWTSHKQRLRLNNHYNKYLQSAWNKYKEENFEFIILESSVINYEELNRLEINWIKFYDSSNREKGYNLEAGGSRNKVVSEETRMKMAKNASSESNIKRLSTLAKGRKLSEEHKAALLKSITGRNPSLETRAKIAAANTGKRHSSETIKKLSVLKKGKKGTPHTQESKDKISKTNRGRVFSEEHKRKLSEARRRSAKIKQIVE